jgi:hypothetical protein
MAITIEHYEGGHDGADLVGCFFELVTGSHTEYHFYDLKGKLIHTHPSRFSNGETIKFVLADHDWEIDKYDLTSPLPGGKWKNKGKSEDDDSDGENGTFTAQSGIGEESKGKTAQAY